MGDNHNSHGAERVLSTAWELVPLSFVLDWFLDVSERLGALESSFLRPTLGTWIVHRHRLYKELHYQETGRSTSDGANTNVGTGSRGGSTVEQTYIVERKANPTVSYLPEFKVNLDWKKVADGVALARTLGPRLGDVLSRL